MPWTYEYTSDIWPNILSALLLVALSVYSLRRLSVPGALPFAIACLLALPIGLSMIMTLCAVEDQAKIFWFQVETVFLIACVNAVTCFILEYAWPGRWLTRRNLVLLSIVPFLSLVLDFSNNFHHLAFLGFSVDKLVTPHYGPVGWIIIAYLFILTFINFIVFIWLFRNSPQHRWPVAIMLTAQIAVRVLYLSDFINKDSWFYIVHEYAIVFLAYGIALFGFRFFDPIPHASQTVIHQMHEGMIVLDPEDHVVSLNPAAEQMLRVATRTVKGKGIRELLPAYPDKLPADPDETSTEFSLPVHHPQTDTPERTHLAGNGGGPTWTLRNGTRAIQEVRQYLLRISLLQDWRGLVVGRLLLMRDVTERNQAQVLLQEQQRALAMLQERERLARELHDSIGQVLGYAGFQVEAASKLIQEGQADAAAAQLNRLASVVRDAHADVRKSILDLRTEPVPHRPFFTSLRQYLEGFTNNYGIQTILKVDERLGEELGPPDAVMHIFRILQEALSNARKHSQARSVQVSFTVDDPLIRMKIQDDGVGFDPGQPATATESHFGLGFMRERAETLGGKLWVETAPGEGTCVVLEMPGMEV